MGGHGMGQKMSCLVVYHSLWRRLLECLFCLLLFQTKADQG